MTPGVMSYDTGDINPSGNPQEVDLPPPRLKLVEARPAPAQRTRRFIMLFDDEVEEVLRQIRRGPRPWATMNVWLAVIRLTEFNATEIRASAAEIAERAEVEQIEVYRAMKRLMEIGAVRRIGRGRYRINETVTSRGRPQLAAENGVLVTSP